jgi:hypothetical protein
MQLKILYFVMAIKENACCTSIKNSFRKVNLLEVFIYQNHSIPVYILKTLFTYRVNGTFTRYKGTSYYYIFSKKIAFSEKSTNFCTLIKDNTVMCKTEKNQMGEETPSENSSVAPNEDQTKEQAASMRLRMWLASHSIILTDPWADPSSAPSEDEAVPNQVRLASHSIILTDPWADASWAPSEDEVVPNQVRLASHSIILTDPWADASWAPSEDEVVPNQVRLASHSIILTDPWADPSSAPAQDKAVPNQP